MSCFKLRIPWLLNVNNLSQNNDVWAVRGWEVTQYKHTKAINALIVVCVICTTILTLTFNWFFPNDESDII